MIKQVNCQYYFPSKQTPQPGVSGFMLSSPKLPYPNNLKRFLKTPCKHSYVESQNNAQIWGPHFFDTRLHKTAWLPLWKQNYIYEKGSILILLLTSITVTTLLPFVALVMSSVGSDPSSVPGIPTELSGSCVKLITFGKDPTECGLTTFGWK